MKKSQLSKIIKEETRKTLLEQGRLSRFKKALGIGRKPKQEPIKIPKPAPKIAPDQAMATKWDDIFVTEDGITRIKDEYVSSLQKGFNIPDAASGKNLYHKMLGLRKTTDEIPVYFLKQWSSPAAFKKDIDYLVKQSDFNPQRGFTSYDRLTDGTAKLIARGHRNFEKLADQAVKYPGDAIGIDKFSGPKRGYDHLGPDSGFIVMYGLKSGNPDINKALTARLDGFQPSKSRVTGGQDIHFLAFPESMALARREAGLSADHIEGLLQKITNYSADGMRKLGGVGVRREKNLSALKKSGALDAASRRKAGNSSNPTQFSKTNAPEEKLRDMDTRRNRGKQGPKDSQDFFTPRRDLEALQEIIRQEVRKLLNEIKNS